MSVLRARWAAIGAAVAVTLGAGGLAAVSASSPADAVAFVPISPCRLFDTRPIYLVGDRDTPMTQGETWTVDVTGSHGNCKDIPAEATAVSMNVTADFPSELTFLTIWPAGEPLPNASWLNPPPGKPSPNAVTTRLSADGKMSIYNKKGTVHVLADITGYYIDHNHDDRYYTKTQTDARTPQETVVSVGSADFQPLDATSMAVRDTTDGGAWPAAGATAPGLVAGVQLPNGAVITKATVEYWDSDATEDLTVSLRCEAAAGFTDLYTATGSGTTTGWGSLDLVATGAGMTTTTTSAPPSSTAAPASSTTSSTASTSSTTAPPVGPEADNGGCSYQVLVTNANWGTVTDALRIKAVHITAKTTS